MTATYKRSEIELLLEAGAIQGVEIFASSEGFGIRIKTKNGIGQLLNERGQLRYFSKIDTAAKYLRELGIINILLSLEPWAITDNG